MGQVGFGRGRDGIRIAQGLCARTLVHGCMCVCACMCVWKQSSNVYKCCMCVSLVSFCLVLLGIFCFVCVCVRLDLPTTPASVTVMLGSARDGSVREL